MKKIAFILSVVFFFGVVGCTDQFEELNTDIKNPPSVTANSLFSNATRNLVDLMVVPNVNRNVFRLYSQYWAQTTYPDESQYNMVGRDIPGNMWNIYYRDVLKDYKEAASILNAANTSAQGFDEVQWKNQKAIITIMEAYTYTVLADIFGDVPFTQALDDTNLLPAYDSARSVYDASIANIQAAITEMDVNGSGFSQDIVYGGNVGDWQKFANSVLLKLAVRMASVDLEKARSIAGNAYTGVFASSADNFSVAYEGATPNTNPIHQNLVLSGRNDYVPANTVVDVMNELEDPRRAIWFDQGDFDNYLGGVYGSANAYSGASHLSSVFRQPDLEGVLMTYSEVAFLLAEATEWGLEVGGTAEGFYNTGVKESIRYWGGTQLEADAYLAQPSVAYATAEGDWKAKIGKQKWISLFNNGFEGWSTWRLYDMDYFNVPEGMTQGDIPRRLIYPADEPTLNGANYSAAAANYNGDVASAKIFWDVN